MKVLVVAATGLEARLLVDEFEFENQGTLIDVVNRANKRELFEDIEEIRIMKDIRNTIVHEYIEDELIAYTPKLLQIMSNTLNYANRYKDKK